MGQAVGRLMVAPAWHAELTRDWGLPHCGHATAV